MARETEQLVYNAFAAHSADAFHNSLSRSFLLATPGDGENWVSCLFRGQRLVARDNHFLETKDTNPV